MNVTTPNIILVAVGGIVLLVGLFSNAISQRLSISAPVVALIAGILIGPHVCNLVAPEDLGDPLGTLETLARVTLAIGLMGIALGLPKDYILRNPKRLALMLGVLMPTMWITSGVIIYFVTGMGFWTSMTIAAIVTPTDPILASSMVSGDLAERALPARVRNLISAESGANDGLAYAFLMLPLLLLVEPIGPTIRGWLLDVVLREIIVAVVAGGIIGIAAGRMLEWARRHRLVERTSLLSYAIALALLTLGTTRLLGTDGILAVFVAGVAFDHSVTEDRHEAEEHIVEAVTQFLNLPVFVFFGLLLPWDRWFALGWIGILLVVLVLALRRLPWVLLVQRIVPDLLSKREALFVGFYGPIGIAALFYAAIAIGRTGNHAIWTISSLVVFSSIVVHGITVTPATRWLRARIAHPFDDGDRPQEQVAES